MDEEARIEAAPDPREQGSNIDEAWDRYLVHRDEQAFEQVVRAYHGLVYSVCRRSLGPDRDSIDDAVQDTFCKLATNAERIQTNLAGWLYSCALNTTRSALRARLRRERREATWAEEREQAQAEPDHHLKSDLDEAIEILDEPDKMLIIEHFFVGRSQTELAQILHVTPSAVNKRLSRALEKLRLRLAQVGVTVSISALSGSLKAGSAEAAVVGTTQHIAHTALTTTGVPRGLLASCLLGIQQISLKSILVGVTALATILVSTAGFDFVQRRPPTIVLRGTIANGGGHAGDRFGQAIAIDGRHALVGAPLDNSNGNVAGAVYAFRSENATWVQTQKLRSPEGVGSTFGGAIALDGDFAAIGVGSSKVNVPGTVHLYESTPQRWMLRQTFHAEDGKEDPISNLFGVSVAIRGEHLLVGACYDDERGENAGAVYAYQLQDGEWSFVDKLLPPEEIPRVGFGWRIALDGDHAAIAAPCDGDNGYLAGAVYSYQFLDGRWRVSQKLTAIDGKAGHRFGESLAMSDGLLAVGAADRGIQGAGAIRFEVSKAGKMKKADDRKQAITRKKGPGWVYLYEKHGDEWMPQQILTPGEKLSRSEFGAHLALRDDVLVVSARYASSAAAPRTGAAYVYRKRWGVWTEPNVLHPTASEKHTNAGDGVAIGQETIFVGCAEGNPQFSEKDAKRLLEAVQSGKLPLTPPTVRYDQGRTFFFELD